MCFLHVLPLQSGESYIGPSPVLCFVSTHKFCVSYEAKYHQRNANVQKDLLKTVLRDVDHLGDWRGRRWAGLEVCVDCLWSPGIAEAEVLYSYVVKVQVWRLPAVIPGRLIIPSFLRFLLDVLNPITIDQKNIVPLLVACRLLLSQTRDRVLSVER